VAEYPFATGERVMGNWRDEVLSRAWSFGEKHECRCEEELGFGYDGIVLSTDRQSAIKVLRFKELYERERDVYSRLRDVQISSVRGFNVPRLILADDQLYVVEMTIVSPPFVLDFAGAYLDQSPDFPSDVIEAWRAEKVEQFGDRWPEVLQVIASFRRWGIHLADVKPGNIEFLPENIDNSSIE
jgi:hypothetical protein